MRFLLFVCYFILLLIYWGVLYLVLEVILWIRDLFMIIIDFKILIHLFLALRWKIDMYWLTLIVISLLFVYLKIIDNLILSVILFEIYIFISFFLRITFISNNLFLYFCIFISFYIRFNKHNLITLANSLWWEFWLIINRIIR
jgi:hypothetical protein